MRTLIHQIIHAIDIDTCAREPAEVIVKTVTFTVCANTGLGVDGESIPYIAGWSEHSALDAVTQLSQLLDQHARRIETAPMAPYRARSASNKARRLQGKTDLFNPTLRLMVSLVGGSGSGVLRANSADHPWPAGDPLKSVPLPQKEKGEVVLRSVVICWWPGSAWCAALAHGASWRHERGGWRARGPGARRRGDVADGGVQPSAVVVAEVPRELSVEGCGVGDLAEVRPVALEVTEERFDVCA